MNFVGHFKLIKLRQLFSLSYATSEAKNVEQLFHLTIRLLRSAILWQYRRSNPGQSDSQVSSNL